MKTILLIGLFSTILLDSNETYIMVENDRLVGVDTVEGVFDYKTPDGKTHYWISGKLIHKIMEKQK